MKIRTVAALCALLMVPACTTFTGDKPWLPSPYPHNPEFDVYVRGEYVGSDPDPRIRASLRDEARGSHNLGRRD